MNRIKLASPLRQAASGSLALAMLCLCMPNEAVADCMADCQSTYDICVRGFDERQCATDRSVCQNRCVVRGAGTFGAIAFSGSTGGFGYSFDYRTKSQAEARALRECAARAKKRDCRILVWFRNQCGALAVGPRHTHGSAYAPDFDTARRQALSYCRQASNGAACEIMAAFCSRPSR